jgi:hypothetical protein
MACQNRTEKEVISFGKIGYFVVERNNISDPRCLSTTEFW